ncbi:MAG: family 20 glycosylhydrolase, partial [Chitinophagaceae bacterium]|nr:family 20 glycosylhydrolase [Chitinophagaceae bacterium]
MRRIFLVQFFLILLVSISAQDINIIPQPAEIKKGKGVFSITNETAIAYDENNKGSAAFLDDFFRNNFGLELEVTKSGSNVKNAITFVKSSDQGKKGYYKLDCNSKGITISGDNEGIFYGIQTLGQLLTIPVSDKNEKLSDGNINVPQVSIVDYPRFQYRGMHLDVCRHFFPVSFVKKYIDYLAYHKLNIFHWHLTEDQGWRIEIKKYPELTTIGSKRNGTIIGRYPGTGNDNIPYGGSYTQEEIKEVVQYAKDRYIEVIPEIEMPGHGSAAIAAYPWLSCFPEKPTEIPKNMISNKSVEEQKNGRVKLVQETWGVFDDIFCAGKDSTFLFLQNVIDEVIPLFPSKYFHIGGDEAPKTHWKTCPQCQKKIKELKLKDEHELQSWFVQRIEKYLNSKGKTLIGWDEILEGGLAPNAVVMSWRGEAGGIEAAKQKHKVIMTPGSPLYFDHSQSENEDSVTIGGYNPIEKVYAYDPIPKELTEEEGKYILGAQANVWAEYIGNEKKVEYTIFPRMAALSEMLWTPKEKKDWNDFEKRLPEQIKRYENWGANYSKAYFDLKTTVLPTDDYKGVLWKLETKTKAHKIKYNKILDINDPPNPTAFLFYDKPIQIIRSGKYIGWSTENGENLNNSISQKFSFNKATGKKITLTTEASKNYPGDGAFTLVNGVINEKGFSRTKEFLGFSGANCEAIIDLGTEQKISSVVVNTFKRTSSWIWQPLNTEVFGSLDGTTWKSLSMTDDFVESKTVNGKGKMNMSFDSSAVRFVKIVVKNWGEIPVGNPGAGK